MSFIEVGGSVNLNGDWVSTLVTHIREQLVSHKSYNLNYETKIEHQNFLLVHIYYQLMSVEKDLSDHK